MQASDKSFMCAAGTRVSHIVQVMMNWYKGMTNVFECKVHQAHQDRQKMVQEEPGSRLQSITLNEVSFLTALLWS